MFKFKKKQEKDKTKLRGQIIELLSNRIIIIGVLLMVLFCLLIYRLFVLQIIQGDEHLANFNYKIKKKGSVFMKSRTVKLITAAAFLIPALLYIASFLISVYAGSLPWPEGPFDANSPPPEWYSYLKSLEIKDIATVVLHVSEAAAAASVMAARIACGSSSAVSPLIMALMP